MIKIDRVSYYIDIDIRRPALLSSMHSLSFYAHADISGTFTLYLSSPYFFMIYLFICNDALTS